WYWKRCGDSDLRQAVLCLYTSESSTDDPWVSFRSRRTCWCGVVDSCGDRCPVAGFFNPRYCGRYGVARSLCIWNVGGAMGFLVLQSRVAFGRGPIAALAAVYFLDRVTRRTAAPGKERPRLMRVAHWGSGAATAFARGINDAPKMAALGSFFLLANPSEAAWVPYSVVAVAVFFGSLALGHRVVVTAIGKHAPLDQVQKSKAGAATALVVSAGAFLGAPMS